MKINKLQIGNFGKFKDYELDLKDGFQIVYGKNEDGKSTLMAFIKMMFYSKLESGRTISNNSRRRYQPWDGSMMNGAIEFEHGGIAYRLQKDIGATPSGDKIKLINLGTGENVPIGKSEEVGKRFFGLDLPGFERSVFISQIGSFSPNKNKDEVADKLISNLVNSGDEGVSHQMVINRLNNAIEDMESKNGKKGTFVYAKNELQLLYNERLDIQIQEDEQRESMEIYHQLEEKLSERKNIKRLLDLHEDKIEYEKLKSLIEKVIQNTQLEAKLEKENIPYKNLKEFLDDCNYLMNESEKAKGTLEKLKGSTESGMKDKENIIPISEDEHKHLRDLVNREKAIDELLKRIDENFMPALISFNEAMNNYNNAEALLNHEEALVKEYRKFYDDYKKYEDEFNSKSNEKDKIIGNFEKEKSQWSLDKQLREKDIKFTSEKLSMQSQGKAPESKDKNKNPMKTLSIVIGIVSIILTLIAPVFIIGVVIAVVIGLRGGKSKNQSNTSSKDINSNVIDDFEKELQTLREENDEREKEINDKTKDYEDKILNISNAIIKIQEQLEDLKENKTAYENLLNSYTELKNNKDKALNILTAKKDVYIKERNYIVGKYSDNPSLKDDLTIIALEPVDQEGLVAREYRDKIELLYNDLRLNIGELMKEKSCLSMKEYENKFIDYASDSKNRKAIDEAEQEYIKKSKEFLSKVNEYEIVHSYEEAKLLIKRFSEEVTQLERGKDEIINISKGMGYDSPSLDYLIEEESKLKPSIKLLEEVDADSYTIEELKERHNELTEENIEDQILEIQKKIKTPDKNLSQVLEEIVAKEKEVKEKESYLNSLKLAVAVMQEASDEMRQSFGPELNKKTADIFKSLTNGKYGNILVTKDYDISVQSGIHYREWRYLSNGTVDQAYLSLRLAITELISDNSTSLPLFLDDVMIQYDDERMEAALKFLSDYAKEKGSEFQVLLFTCHKYVVDSSKPYDAEVVYI